MEFSARAPAVRPFRPGGAAQGAGGGVNATYCIIGAGAAGIGAGHGLSRLGEDDFLILEREVRIGGRAAAEKDASGFLWEPEPRPLCERFKTFTRLVDDLLGPDAPRTPRSAWVRAGGAWVPQPFQRNLRYLPALQRLECLRGLLGAALTRAGDPGGAAQPETLARWLELTYGPGIARLYLAPQQAKALGAPCEELDWRWAAQCLAPADLDALLETLILERDDTGHGPDAVVRTPAFGGSGELLRRMSKRLRERILIGQEVVRVDPVARVAHLRGGGEVGYAHLFSTMPLDQLVGAVLDDPPEAVRRAGAALRHASALAVGVGLRAPRPRPGQDSAHWMEFPQDNCPFHRVTHLHNFAPGRVPEAGARALLAELSWRGPRPEPVEAMIRSVLEGLENVSLLAPGGRDEVAALWHAERSRAVPLPDLGRDAALRTIMPYLEAQGIASRGLLGGWRHEVGELDQCVMQGIEWARRVVHGEPETVYCA
jgi:UDP-galactopyranose mutase